MSRLPVVILIVLLFSFEARADYHYASHTGSNQYPYTSWETAADSIQKAINAATAGDTIYVGSGVWDDVPLYLTDSLALIGMGIDSTTIHKGEHAGFIHFITAHNYTLIQGITFNGNNTQYTHDAIHGRLGRVDIDIIDNRFVNLFGGVLMAENSGRIVNNIFLDSNQGINADFDACSLLVKNNTFSGGQEPINAFRGRWFIENNVFCYHRNAAMASLLNVDAYRAQDTAYIANNLFYRNLEGETIITTALLAAGSRAYLENNTFIGARGENRRHIAVNCGPDGTTERDLTNNVITGFRWAVKNYSSVRPVRLYYNDLWNNDFDAYPSGAGIDLVEGNLHADPMFMDSTDFRLQAYSPLIDAGDPAILDVDGTRSDIGCFGGPGGCSYVYLDLAPKIPDSLSARVDSSGIHITWRNNYEADFNRYQVFRDTVSGFSPSVFNMMGEPDTSNFLDTNVSPGVSYYYRFTSVDNQDNISDHSTELVVYQTGMAWDKDGNLRPEYACIEKAYPNPFNQDVTIVYSASNLGPQPPEIKLVIYDIQGRIVKTLVDERKPAGTYRVVWDGKNDLGENVSSGNYITKLYQWGLGAGDFPVKITLVR